MIVDDDIFYGQLIYKAIECGDIEGLRDCVCVEDVNVANGYDGSTYLMFAVGKSDARIVELLINSGADLYARNDLGDMAIHLAVKSGNASVVEVFCEHGCDLNLMGQSATPIGYALRFDKFELAMYLFERGADIDIADEFGVTPRRFALESGIKLR